MAELKEIKKEIILLEVEQYKPSMNNIPAETWEFCVHDPLQDCPVVETGGTVKRRLTENAKKSPKLKKKCALRKAKHYLHSS